MNVVRPKLGVLTIGRKRPGFDQEWNQLMRRETSAALTALNFTDAQYEEPVVDDQTTRAARIGLLRWLRCAFGASTVAGKWATGTLCRSELAKGGRALGDAGTSKG